MYFNFPFLKRIARYILNQYILEIFSYHPQRWPLLLSTVLVVPGVGVAFITQSLARDSWDGSNNCYYKDCLNDYSYTYAICEHAEVFAEFISRNWMAAGKGMCIHNFGMFCQVSFLGIKPSCPLPAMSEKPLSPWGEYFQPFLIFSYQILLYLFLAVLCLFLGISTSAVLCKKTMGHTCFGACQIRGYWKESRMFKEQCGMKGGWGLSSSCWAVGGKVRNRLWRIGAANHQDFSCRQKVANRFHGGGRRWF